ncbi:hypothetical protein KATP_32630 [Kluyvera ascorbata]|nr:hypothetical protein KATP_32630 [Kluyvera ascorbata]
MSGAVPVHIRFKVVKSSVLAWTQNVTSSATDTDNNYEQFREIPYMGVTLHCRSVCPGLHRP